MSAKPEYVVTQRADLRVLVTAEDVIGRVSEYVGHGLDKFVLWPIATPDAWAKQVELVGSEIANHYMKAAA